MIDIENVVFRAVKAAAVECDSSVSVYSDYTNVPESFPCVYITEDSNTTYEKSIDASHTEHHAKVMYAINVYADNAGTKKSVAKKLMNAVDNAMISLGFIRISCSRIPNEERTIYRIAARYQAVVEESYYDSANDKYINKIYKS